MKKLIEILGDIQYELLHGSIEKEVSGLCLDSRKVVDGSIYFALRGSVVDGHDFIDSAIQKGASVIVCEGDFKQDHGESTILRVEDSRQAMARMANTYYGNPSERIALVGITGTNGKTTVATLLWQLFTRMGSKTGLISTVENKIGNRVVPASHTTPDVITLNALLAEMVDEGCEYAFMEVSSHAIDQRRIDYVGFKGGVFTNISHDHLDYHKTFKNYIEVKKKFFDDLSTDAFGLSNIDDKRGQVMLQNSKAKRITYGLRGKGDYLAKLVSNDIYGLLLKIDGQEAHFRLVGEFNAYNLLAVYAVAVLLGFEKDKVLLHLSDIPGAEGRFEKIKIDGVDIVGIVDYAHTPDALENVLKTISSVKKKQSRVITVVGCGGDRDGTKRPKMAKIGARFSDVLILTSDNPRTEDPDSILDDMEEGLTKVERNEMLRIVERDEAIKKAVEVAENGDVILIAGKGHEKYQDKNGVKTPFDDKKVLRAALQEVT